MDLLLTVLILGSILVGALIWRRLKRKKRKPQVIFIHFGDPEKFSMLDKNFLSDFVQTLISRGQADMAEKLIYTISQDYPNEPSHLLLLAEIVLAMGNPQAAHNYLNSAVNLLNALNMELNFNDRVVELQAQISNYEEQSTTQGTSCCTEDVITEVNPDKLNSKIF